MAHGCSGRDIGASAFSTRRAADANAGPKTGPAGCGFDMFVLPGGTIGLYSL